MPIRGFDLPDDPGGISIDDPTSGPHKGSGGGGFGSGGPFIPGGGFGGGGSGGFFAPNPYSAYGQFDPMQVQRRQMGMFGQPQSNYGPQAMPQSPMSNMGRGPMNPMQGGASMNAMTPTRPVSWNGWGAPQVNGAPVPDWRMQPGAAPLGGATGSGPYGGGGDYWDLNMGLFGGSQGNPAPHATSTDAETLLDMIIGGQGRGQFGPTGDPRVMNAWNNVMNQQGLDQEHSALLGAQLDSPNNFYARGVSRRMARANAGAAKANFFNQFGLQQSQNYNNLVNQALMHKVGEFDNSQSRAAYLADKNHQELASRGGGMGAMIGSGLGALGGAFLGNPMLGAQLGGALGGSFGHHGAPDGGQQTDPGAWWRQD